MSTKGQVVIPDKIRRDLEPGTSFYVIRKDDLIVLKKISGLTKAEEREVEDLKKIWKNIDSGRAKRYKKDEFLKELENW